MGTKSYIILQNTSFNLEDHFRDVTKMVIKKLAEASGKLPEQTKKLE